MLVFAKTHPRVRLKLYSAGLATGQLKPSVFFLTKQAPEIVEPRPSLLLEWK